MKIIHIFAPQNHSNRSVCDVGKMASHSFVTRHCEAVQGRHYGQIDSLVITRTGNQLKTIEDYAQKHLTYTGASDFYDGYTYDTEYYYNANGALESDINRDIDLIQYDDLGNARCIYYFGQNQIEYVYAADGTKLRTIHRPSSSTALTDSIDYIGNLILKNGQPSMYLFDGGYATFDQNGAVDGWHYYIQDYMGNNRMVVNKNGTVEQITHYYPYGGVIGDISTNENVQKYKFEGPRSHQKEIDNLLARRRAFRRGVELDRTFGLDYYDIHARQYFAMAPMWDRIDPLAEKYYGISPYAYCEGDPVNLGDYNGEAIYMLFYSIGNSGNGDKMFYSAAQTRKADIENSKEYDPTRDIVIMQDFEDVAKLKNLVSDVINKYSSIYGKTKEFGVWSHAGVDGPTGTCLTSSDVIDEKQMTLAGWSKINFNWDQNATAIFYGCFTGKNKGNGSFAQNISNLENFSDVTIAGQTNKAYPSATVNHRDTSFLNWLGSFSTPTYLVGWEEGLGFDKNRFADKMVLYKNGIFIRYQYQQGKSR